MSDVPLIPAVFARGENPVESAMWLIVYYVVFMIIGDICAYLIGLATERAFGDQASLIVFLTLYFAFLWVSWLLAVWVTEPKHTATAAKSA
jgi:cation transporter-like permease